MVVPLPSCLREIGDMIMAGFDPYREDILDDPFPHYAWLRKQPSAYLVERTGFYAVSRYVDVVAVTREHAIFSSTGGVGASWGAHPMMSMYDPPEHTRLRRIVASAFTPKTVQLLRPSMRERTRELLDELRGRDGFDFVTAFAEPLVATVIADLIGLPRDLTGNFRRWSLSITGMLAGNLDPAQGEPDRRELVRTIRGTKGRTEGLLGVLGDASREERLNDNELTAFCVLLLVAGFETTVNGMANGAFTLMRHPSTFEEVRAGRLDRARCIEEILRFDPPVHAFFRNTLRPYTFPDGSSIPEGKKVMVLFGSACHDDDHFANASVFDALRPVLDHLAFGNGVHYCIGAPLARALYEVVLEALAELDARLVAQGTPVRTRNSMLRGFYSMPVTLVRGSSR